MTDQRRNYRTAGTGLLAAGLAVAVVLSSVVSVLAQESRSSKRIRTPANTGTPLATPSAKGVSHIAIENADPVSREEIKAAVKKVLSKWNTVEFAASLTETFPNKEQMVDSVRQYVPRDARLRILGIEGTRTLRQYYETKNGILNKRVSEVSATVRIEVVFNNPIVGAQRLEGRNELILIIEKPLRRSSGAQ